MNDRFKNLTASKDTIYRKSQQPKKHVPESENRLNTFKQKRPTTQYSQENNQKRYSKQHNQSSDKTNNKFIRQSKCALKQEFDLKSTLFPDLNKNGPITNSTEKQLDYLEKIKQTKQQTEKKETVPAGWIVLKLNKEYQQKYNKHTNDTFNKYYNPAMANLILYNREKYREELNDILGDISPYWNMDYLHENDEFYEDDYDGYDEDEFDEYEYWDER